MPEALPEAADPRTPFERLIERLRPGSAVSVARWYWLAPLFAIVLFIAVMLALLYTLRQDEIDRQQQALFRDVQATQEAFAARLASSQEELLQLTNDFDAGRDGEAPFLEGARAILRSHPSMMAIAWVDTHRTWRRVVSSDVQFDGGPREEGDLIETAVSRVAFEAARDRHQPRYSAPYAAADGDMYIELHVPLYDGDRFEGTAVGVTSLSVLARTAIPKEAAAKFNVVLVDGNGHTLASKLGPGGLVDSQLASSFVTLPLGPPLNDVYLKATAYRTRSQLADKFLVWAVIVLSLLIVWTLVSQMRHLRRRQEAEAARDRIFNLSLDILAVIDNRCRIVRLNPACARILGRDPASLTGASLLDLVHPDDRAATSDELAHVVEGGVGSAFENRCRRFNEDGTSEYRWLVWNFNPDLQTRGEKRLLYAVAHDITQRRARQYALQAETAFRRAMEDSLLTGMRVLDLEGRITYVNPAFCRMLGFDETELLGAMPPFPYWPPRDARPERAHPAPDARRRDAADRPRGARAPQRRHQPRHAHVRVAADRGERRPERLDHVDDRHHAEQARARGAGRGAGALPDGARRARRRGVGVRVPRRRAGRSRRAAVREPPLPQPARRRRAQPPRARRGGPGRAGRRRVGRRRRRAGRLRRARGRITRVPSAGSRSARARSAGSTARRCACRSRPTSRSARRRTSASASRKRRCS